MEEACTDLHSDETNYTSTGQLYPAAEDPGLDMAQALSIAN